MRDISLETLASNDLSCSWKLAPMHPRASNPPPQVVRSNSLEELQERLQQFNQRRWAPLNAGCGPPGPAREVVSMLKIMSLWMELRYRNWRLLLRTHTSVDLNDKGVWDCYSCTFEGRAAWYDWLVFGQEPALMLTFAMCSYQ